MTDIRCLVCDHVNDASAERCWYCQALLQGKPTTPSHVDQSHPGVKPSESGVTEPGETESANAIIGAELEEEVPEWLARIRKLKEQELPAAELEDEAPAEEEEIPTWLKNLRAENSDELEIKPAENPLKEESESQLEPQVDPASPVREDEAEVLDQLDSLRSSSKPETTSRISGSNEGDSGDGTPLDEIPTLNTSATDELDGKTSPPPGVKPGAGPALPICVDDLPDWLNSEKDLIEKITSPSQGQKGQPALPVGGKLEKGMLPAWLQAIRPLEAVAPAAPTDESQAQVEEQGVLAGIEGTLKAVNLADAENKPAMNQQELLVTPAQLRNAELFHNMLQADLPTSTETKRRAPSGRNKQFRIIIAVILFLTSFSPFLLRSIPAVIPVLYSQEVVDTLTFIEELPSEKPVLVAAQFEAGLAGEIAWTMEPVIEHLVSRGIPMVLTSTNVTGYAILQDQINTAAENAVNYPINEKVVNLGFLPGGTIGLISLVSDPRMTFPFTMDLAPAWELPAIENVNTLSEFGAVFIVTDNPEIARAWVEQSGRVASPPPLIAVVSAQASPLIQPYHDSGQIRGYVSGASGALTYELIRQLPGKASSTYSSYQLVILAAASLVFFGGMLSLIISSVDEKKKKGGR